MIVNDGGLTSKEPTYPYPSVNAAKTMSLTPKSEDPSFILERDFIGEGAGVGGP